MSPEVVIGFVKGVPQLSVPVPLLVNTPFALPGQTAPLMVRPVIVVAPADKLPVVEIACVPKLVFTLAPLIRVDAALIAVIIFPPVATVAPMVGFG